MTSSKKTIKHKKNNKNSQKTSKYKSSKTDKNIKLNKTLKPLKPLKGGFIDEENFSNSTEQGLFDSLKVNTNSGAKPRNDPPAFPSCCIS